ncbi:hypothetical protein INT44_006121 [Umbelopsis vinacea]|uniref:Cupin type-2 domain-containing protein n=1 Tax=Umbelopsis vinacea TaxID=44442 RepID=A0A8H7U8E5_9FUNG|nr:hypothetical protein INT44_006121 [Umbelopsis vinacea]
MSSSQEKSTAQELPNGTKIDLLYCHVLPNAPTFKLATLKITYEPGAFTEKHRHGNAFVSASVLSGRVQSQINDGPVEEFGEGDSWSENPGDIHTISRNASQTEGAVFIATFVCPVDQEQFVIFDCPACKVVQGA